MTSQVQNSAQQTGSIQDHAPAAAGSQSIDEVLAAAINAPSIDPSTAQPGLPVKPPLTAVLEIVLLIFIPAALDHFVPGFPSLSEMQPHPFWLPVLLVSIQYGTVSGLLAAGCAIAASSFLGWPEQEIGENHFAYLLRVWSQPVLWLATALVLGQFRMRQIEYKQELARQVAELNSQRKSIATFATNLRSRCERLEREMVGRRSSASQDLLAMLGRMSAAREPAAAREALASCLAAAFGKCQASVFVREGDTLRAVEQHGWAQDARWKSTLAASDPLYANMSAEGRGLSILQPGDEVHLGGEGIAAAPILSPADGRLRGMIKIEVMDPAEIDANLGLRLSAFALQVAPLLESAHAWPQAAAAPAVRFAPAPTVRTRLWRQLRRRPGQAKATESQRPLRTG